MRNNEKDEGEWRNNVVRIDVARKDGVRDDEVRRDEARSDGVRDDEDTKR